jgi:hypothetical protein
VNCARCGGEWSVTADVSVGYDAAKGTDFCSHCGTPAPWLSRKKLVQWLKGQAFDLEPARRLEVTSFSTAWPTCALTTRRPSQRGRKCRGWRRESGEKAKPVIDILVAEGLKKTLGL